MFGANKKKKEERQQTESPDQRKDARHSLAKRIFAGNTTNMFLIFNVFSYALFFIIGPYAILIMIATQFAALLYSDRIILNLGSVRPTADQPIATIVDVRSTPEVLGSVSVKGRQVLSEITGEIHRAFSNSLLPRAAMTTTTVMNAPSSAEERTFDGPCDPVAPRYHRPTR